MVAILMIQVTADSGLDQRGDRKGGKKWLGSGWNLKVGPTTVAKGLKGGCEKKKSDCQVWGLQAVKVELP